MSTLKIILFFFVFLFFSVPTYLRHQQKQAREQWPENKCKIQYAPFAGFVMPDPEKKGKLRMGIENVHKCGYTMVQGFFSVLMKPFRFVIGLVHKVLDAMKAMLDKFRQQLMVIRKMLMHIAFKVMERLQNIGAVFINIFLRLREMMKRGIATFQTLTYTLETVALTLTSIKAGPIGTMGKLAAHQGPAMVAMATGPAGFALFPGMFRCTFEQFCFAPHTEILLDQKPMPLYRVPLGGDITGRMRFRLDTRAPVYCLDKDIVTASHEVRFQKKWVPVSDHPAASLCLERPSEVYCLATRDHKIRTATQTYRDWEETSNPTTLLRWKEAYLEELNGRPIRLCRPASYLNHEGFASRGLGFQFESYAFDKNIIGKNIIGKNIIGKNIIGIGEWQADEATEWYVIAPETYITASTLLYVGDTWLPAGECLGDEMRASTPPSSRIQHVATQTGVFYLGGHLIHDFIEAPSWHLNTSPAADGVARSVS